MINYKEYTELIFNCLQSNNYMLAYEVFEDMTVKQIRDSLSKDSYLNDREKQVLLSLFNLNIKLIN